jgi:hypothetical protein
MILHPFARDLCGALPNLLSKVTTLLNCIAADIARLFLDLVGKLTDPFVLHPGPREQHPGEETGGD